MLGGVDALILAGAPNSGGLAEFSSEAYEALVEINGISLLEYVLRGVLESQCIDQIAVVSPVNTCSVPKISNLKLRDNVKWVKCGESLVENLMLGIEALPKNKKIITFTSDIPFITGKIIDQWIKECEAVPAEAYYPIIPKEVSETSFPGCKRTYFNLKEGSFTGGNIFVFSHDLVKNNENKITKIFNMRKNPIEIASMLGPAMVLKFIAGKLSIDDIEKKVKEVFNISGKAMICRYAEIGMDVDKKEDLLIAQQLL